jgi:hypothetical protein
MNCILCEKEILPEEDKFYVPVDVPYVNIKIHRECLISKGYDYIIRYLTKNPEIVYNYIENRRKNGRK